MYPSKLLLRILEKRCGWDQLTKAKNSFVILFLDKNVGYSFCLVFILATCPDFALSVATDGRRQDFSRTQIY